MSEITKPIMLDETGQAIKDQIAANNPSSQLTAIAQNLALIAQSSNAAQTLAQLAKTIADEANSIAKGATVAQVFDTEALMTAWIKNSANKGKLKVGDNLYIKAIDVPDYWVSAVLQNPNASGAYYEVSKLETGKVDLNDVVSASSDEDTTIDFAYGQHGNVSKRISAANLASVVARQLGVDDAGFGNHSNFKTRGTVSSANGITEGGIWRIFGGTDTPFATGTLVMYNNDWPVQEFIGTDRSHWSRMYQGSSWKQGDKGDANGWVRIDNFGASDAAGLASVVAEQMKASKNSPFVQPTAWNDFSAINIDNDVSFLSGVYLIQIGQATGTFPEGSRGIYCLVNFGGTYGAQLLFGVNTTDLHYRIQVGNGWTSWVNI